VLIGLLLAMGCSVCYGTATVLQAAATRSVEPGTGSGVDPALLLRAIRQWRYLSGFGLDGLGFLLQVVAPGAQYAVAGPSNERVLRS
jgi:hypothetical protein